MTATSRRRVAKLADGRRLEARWQFPAHPMIALAVNGRALGHVDYVEASASVHWALRVEHRGHEVVIGLPALAGRVPEELDADEGLCVAALDHALRAAADRLGDHGPALEPEHA
jgi:hypothetical protein